jgi:hypothetical protein
VPLIPFVVALVVLFLLVLSTPLLLILRYRAGTMRRRARIGIAILNFISFLISAAIFIWFAAVAGFWVRHSFSFSLAGLLAGCVLGLLGLVFTRWEKTGSFLYYTPNRWFVLLITLGVAARLLYGLWRIWHAWHQAGPDSSWIAAAGIAGSMSVGALVLGYYLAYAAGICWQLRKTR